MKYILDAFMTDESGATAIEYGLIATLIAVAIIGAVGNLGDDLETKFGEIDTALDDAGD